MEKYVPKVLIIRTEATDQGRYSKQRAQLFSIRTNQGRQTTFFYRLIAISISMYSHFLTNRLSF